MKQAGYFGDEQPHGRRRVAFLLFDWRVAGRGKSTAFTLVELLVVIGIIGILVSILMVTVGKARKKSEAIYELSSIRQVVTSYIQYAQENRNWLLPGHIAGHAVPDDAGNPISPVEPTNRWPWRLMASAGYTNKKVLYIGERRSTYFESNTRGTLMWAYAVSLYPSFALNYFNLGGDVMGPANNAPGVVYKINQVKQATDMIAFVSARAPGATGAPGDLPIFVSGEGGGIDLQGYFMVRPPIYRSTNGTLISSWPTYPFTLTDLPITWGYVTARCDGKVATAFVDGHCELKSIDELRDMRLWSNAAQEAGDANYGAP